MKIAGKRVSPVELWEARIIRDASLFRAQVRRGPRGYDELPPPPTLEAARRLVGDGTDRADRTLVYAVTPTGRACCVTWRILQVYDACARGDLSWGDAPVAVTPNPEKRRPWP